MIIPCCICMCDVPQVRVLYTAPTLIRSLMQHGDHFVTQHDRSSLRILGTVGEPINPHAWDWYHQVRLGLWKLVWRGTGGLHCARQGGIWPFMLAGSELVAGKGLAAGLTRCSRRSRRSWVAALWFANTAREEPLWTRLSTN